MFLLGVSLALALALAAYVGLRIYVSPQSEGGARGSAGPALG